VIFEKDHSPSYFHSFFSKMNQAGFVLIFEKARSQQQD